jgi:ABC-2 type transport system ATP-binding protein
MTPTQASPSELKATSAGVRQTDHAIALDVRGLRKTFRATRRAPERRALVGVDLTIPAGQWAAILGPNGSGKSTLVRILAGAEAPAAGTITIYGRPAAAGAGIRDRRMAAARLGIVFQRPGLDRLLTVRENLEAQASLFGIRGKARQQRISQLASQFDLGERLNDAVAALSGGLQRRVDLARALLHEPELLVLDEATTGLDHQSRSAFLDLVSTLRHEREAVRPLTVLMTTHLMDEAERAQRVVMMSEGAIVADGVPSQLRDSCGGRILRVWPGEEQGGEALAVILRQYGFSITRGETSELVGRGEPSLGVEPDFEQAALELARLRVSFQVAPPDLGDAYLSLTGRSLAENHREITR